MRRRWSGGTYMAVGCGDSVEFENEGSLGRFKSSDWGERLFCKQCGSSLMWQTKDAKHQNVSLQAFEDPQEFEFANQVFVDCKPDNYSFTQQTNNMTEKEVMTAFAASPEEGNNG
jgi:hypothetical protein